MAGVGEGPKAAGLQLGCVEAPRPKPSSRQSVALRLEIVIGAEAALLSWSNADLTWLLTAACACAGASELFLVLRTACAKSSHRQQERNAWHACIHPPMTPGRQWRDSAHPTFQVELSAADVDMPAQAPPPPLSNLARQRLLEMQELPMPGHGRTLERWRMLAALGHEDLCLAKVLEAHYDAVAIMHELGATVAEDQLLAVWAAEGPACTLRVDAPGRLHGDKPWCSGSDLVDAALVTVRSSEGVQLYRVDASQWQNLDEDPWPAVGMTSVPSTTVRFDAAQAEAIGAMDAYLLRPGFWHGGAGIAAVWFGAATAVAERMQHACNEGLRARLLGKVDLALAPAAALLRELAHSIDLSPELTHHVQTVRVRSVVERAATQVLDLAGRALGPAPMCMEEAHARRWADLTIFMRQSHGDKDWAWLGQQSATQVMPWAL